MRLGVAAVLVMSCLLSCAPKGSGVTSPASSVAPLPATIDALTPYFGSYGTDDGDILIIARMGWYFDLRDSAYRTMFATTSPNRFTIGHLFLEPVPKFADLVFASGTLTVADSARKRVGRRINYKQTDVNMPANGATLAATITEPLGAGPHAGIVIIHGSERGQRYFYDIWVGVYASIGLAVLTYDKRGGGASTGRYPGEFPTDEALATYADDADSALGFLARWPGVDAKQVGFHGGSQGGWTVPLAILRHPTADFDVLVSAPATTVDQTDLWASYSNGGEVMPTASVEEMLAAVRANHSGYDPAPALRALAVPTLWLLGTNDRTVPTAVCVEVVAAMHKPNFTVHLLPTGHGMLVNPTGLGADDQRSPGLAPDLVPTLTMWVKRSTASQPGPS
ncbi:MAG TPA: alpha/beta hydrolase [Candidatus Dormibacteraeota bacterium]|nr:alpha/beta hydrolase [Candidatus Dormibacteraeota bacterium]